MIRPPAKAPRLSRKRRRLFALFSIAAACMVLAAVEGALRLLPAPAVHDPYLRNSYTLGHTRPIRVGGVDCLKLTLSNITHGATDFIPVRKEPGTFRIFCLGESASAGFPHPRAETYSAYLKKGLDAAFPSRKFEVIDMSAHAYPAYLVRLVFFHVLPYDPDLVIIFTGNNEKILSPRYNADPSLAERALWAAKRLRATEWVRMLSSNIIDTDPIMPGKIPLARKAGGMIPIFQHLPAPLRTDPGQFAILLDHYRFAVQSMLDACAKQKVPALLLKVPVNEADWRPAASAMRLRGRAWKQWKGLIDEAGVLSRKGDDRAALEKLAAALALAPDHAETWFETGKLRQRLGLFAEARRAFQRAVDEDANPFRATSFGNAILDKLAIGRGGVDVVDLPAAFERASPGGMVGDNLFFDYVHANRQGNMLIAEQVFNALAPRLAPPGQPLPAFVPPAPSLLPDGSPYSEENDYYLQMTRLWIAALFRQFQLMEPVARLTETLAGRNAGTTPETRGEVYVRPVTGLALKMCETLRREGIRFDDPVPESPGANTRAIEAVDAFYRIL